MPQFVGDLPIWLWWISVLIAPSASVAGVVATLWLTRRRQLRDRLRSARQGAYGRILAALSAAQAKLIVMTAEHEADGFRHFDSPRGRASRERVRGDLRDMARAYRESALILSPAFLAAYADLVEEIVRASLDSEREEMATLLAVVPHAQAVLVRIARDDLDLRRDSPGFQEQAAPSPSQRFSTAARRTPARPSCWSTTRKAAS